MALVLPKVLPKALVLPKATTFLSVEQINSTGNIHFPHCTQITDDMIRHTEYRSMKEESHKFKLSKTSQNI